MSTSIDKILVANRGEIACRIVRTARRLGIATVAVYSDADREALHAELADEAIRIGPAPAAESYLDQAAIIDACRRTGADAIHPGYGFLAENGDFVDACEAAGIGFIGPPAAAIRLMGSKDAALDLAAATGVPVLAGYRGEDQSDGALARAAEDVGYPLLIKPVAGGGGKGMRVVTSSATLTEAVAASRREADAAFGDDRLLLERFLSHPRHVELQIFADAHGNVVHLFDRDCSIQRRHQKIVEEAPAPGLAKKLRERMVEAALGLVRAIDYRGAGTLEFLVDGGKRAEFYFMEMNTRLQVEHPVTEMVVGVDLVEWQIRVARGDSLPLAQDRIRRTGSAIEARLYAEDPRRDYLPATGRITRFRVPDADARVRVDTGVREGAEVGIHYDPMIAKIVVHGDDREDAVRRLGHALGDCHVAGLPTNLSLLKRIAASPAFAAAALDTGFVTSLGAPAEEDDRETGIAIACLYLLLEQTASVRRSGAATEDPHSPWHTLPGWRLNSPGEDAITIHVSDQEYRLPVRYDPGGYTLALPSGAVAVRGRLLDDGRMLADVADRRLHAEVVRDGEHLDVFYCARHMRMRCHDRDRPGSGADYTPGRLVAPMPGRVIAVLVVSDAQVAKGQPLMVIEAMKMEHTITAPTDGTVKGIAYAVGDLVEEGVELLVVETPASD